MKQRVKEFNKCLLQDSVYLLEVGQLFGSEISRSQCKEGNVISYKIHRLIKIQSHCSGDLYNIPGTKKLVKL